MTKRLLYAFLAILATGGIFTAVCASIWPQHWPAWVSVTYLAGMLLLCAGTGWWLLRYGRDG